METKERKPLGFGKTMLASAVGVIVAFAVMNVISFIFLVGMIMSMAMSLSDKTAAIEGEGLMLSIDLDQPMSEHSGTDIQDLFGKNERLAMDQVLRAIEAAESDDKVSGIYLSSQQGGSWDWAQSEEVREALIGFAQRSGKPVVAYGEAYSQQGYYVASSATLIGMHPSGIVDFRGIGVQAMFFKDLVDKLDIHVELIRPKSNAFKSAGETYTMNHFSEANKEQNRCYVTSIWNHVAGQMAQARRLTVEQINAIADNMEAYIPNDAVRAHILDTLLFKSDMEKMMKERFGGKKIVAIGKYAKSLTTKKAKDKIAIIYAEGDVNSGSNEGMTTGIYSDDLVQAFAQAAEDKEVKAIVLRVNSPGGAVTASESITHAFMQAKAKKPVIVSMSGLAASAGYEMSCNGTVIVAEPTTITGSIGVFAMIPEVGGMLKNKLGISIDTLQTNRNATGIGIMAPLSATAHAKMQRSVEEFYVTFCQRVAKGRNLPTSYVDSIARGRVWTGIEAKRLGLVDTLGGLGLALRIAAEKAGIEDYQVTSLPKSKSMADQLLSWGSKETDDIVLKGNKAERCIRMMMKEIDYWCEMEPLQARLPFVVVEQ